MIWTHADPRLLTPPDLKAEHLYVHKQLLPPHEGGSPGATRDFLLFRHELLRTAANARSGLKHSEFSSVSQRRHPSPVDQTDLRVIDHKYLRAMMIYERWCYVRKQRDIETIDLLFHALMARLGYHVDFSPSPTPWGDLNLRPGQYLADYYTSRKAVPA